MPEVPELLLGGPVLLTGGAGFIGANLAHRLLLAGVRVRLFDNLSRPGVEANLAWLERHHGPLDLVVDDIRHEAALARAVRDAVAVVHLAAQVAVTTSLTDPWGDFEVNAGGTLRLLEALRARRDPPPLLFTSTNKVYGDLARVQLREGPTRYEPIDPEWAAHGLPETVGLGFRSPYGCSKGAADQYVLDYAHSYGLRTVVLRMSCIYGPRQFGTEDQGWVAHFLLRALRGEPVTVYGDGKQVRDLLFVDDLVEAILRAFACLDAVCGRAFNLGGGPARARSVGEVLAWIEEAVGRPLVRHYGPWRPGDQRYFVADTRRFERATGWRARVGVAEGLERLRAWLAAWLAATAEPEPARSVGLR